MNLSFQHSLLTSRPTSTWNLGPDLGPKSRPQVGTRLVTLAQDLTPNPGTRLPTSTQDLTPTQLGILDS